MLPLVLSSDSHVFEPPDLWQTRIDAAFRDRAPRLQRIDGADQIVVEADQILSGIGLISNAGARFEAPETISGQGRLEDVHPAPVAAVDLPDGHRGPVDADAEALVRLRPGHGDLQREQGVIGDVELQMGGDRAMHRRIVAVPTCRCEVVRWSGE